MDLELPPIHEYFIDRGGRGRPRVVRITDDDEGTRGEVWTMFGWIRSEAALRKFWGEDELGFSERDALDLLAKLAVPAKPPAQAKYLPVLLGIAVVHLLLLGIVLVVR
jgi:hypothetical protein